MMLVFTLRVLQHPMCLRRTCRVKSICISSSCTEHSVLSITKEETTSKALVTRGGSEQATGSVRPVQVHRFGNFSPGNCLAGRLQCRTVTYSGRKRLAQAVRDSMRLNHIQVVYTVNFGCGSRSSHILEGRGTTRIYLGVILFAITPAGGLSEPQILSLCRFALPFHLSPVLHFQRCTVFLL